MQTVRRLYLYLMSGITLGVLAVGLRMVLVVLFDALGLGRGAFIGGDPNGDRQQLSLALAFIGVGLPVWGIHWWLAERGLHAGAPHAEDERGSWLRALYLTLVLGVLLAFGASAGADLLRALITNLVGVSPDYGYATPDVAGGLATLVVTGIGWGYHVATRRRDMSVGPLTEAAAWLPRAYLYGAALVGLSVLLQSVGDLVGLIGNALIPQTGNVRYGGIDNYQLTTTLVPIIVAGAVWFGHWWYAGRLVRDSSWRGMSERPSRLRLAYLVAIIAGSVASLVRLVAEAFGAVLVPVFSAQRNFGSDLTASDMARVIGVALVSALPWAVAWWYHRRTMTGEAVASGDPARSATATRLDLHATALVGLAFGAVAIGWLLGLLLDVLLGGDRSSGDFWRGELTMFVPFAVIGSAVWLWWWWRIEARYVADPNVEAVSTVRRSYLLIILAASLIASIGSLAFVLYRLFGTILGAELGGNAASELSAPIGALLAAAAVAAYHGQALRRDTAVRAAEVAAAPEATVAPEARRQLTLIGPAGEDLDVAVAGLRLDLPEGYRLEDS